MKITSYKLLPVLAFILLAIPLAKAHAATLTVNSLLDDGDGSCTISKCTFRDAIASSQDGDTIDLSHLSGTLPLQGAEIDINHSLNIIGPGENNLTLDFTPGSSNPNADLLFYNGLLYGTTYGGGANGGNGTLFAFNPTAGTTTPDLFDFNSTDGAYPHSSLVLSGGLLYGTTAGGGANGGYGTLFAFNPATGTTTPDLFDFNYTDGANPYGSLVLSGGLLYGTTAYGGANGSNGTLFAFNPATGTTTPDLFDFNSTDGANPSGSLVLSGGLLYGTTAYGGANGSNGTLFAFNPSTGTTTPDLFDFNFTDGRYPSGSLVLSGGLLYGTTVNGGANGSNGTLFAFNPATGTTTPDLFDFNYTDGAYPYGSLFLSGGLLYGTTVGGGANGSNGTLFAFNPATGTTTPDLFDFNYTDGAYPYGSLFLSGGLLYGTTVGGGANGSNGTLFAFNPDTGTTTPDLFDFKGQSYIDHEDGNLSISGLAIANGDGPIYEAGTGSLNISNVKFVNNFNDPALEIDQSDGGVTLSDDSFLNNLYGAIYSSSGNLTINNSTFDGNSNSSAIYNGGGDLTISNSTFSNNSVDGGYGGAVYAENGTDSVNLTADTFSGNTAEEAGAVYANSITSLSLTNDTFYNNTASSYGTLESNAATTTITNSTFDTTDPGQDYAVYIGGSSAVANSIFYSVNDNNCDGPITSLGHNIESGTTCGLNAAGDLVNRPPYASDLFDFNNTDGANPYGSLVLSGGLLYGTTENGGANGSNGTLFAFNPATGTTTPDLFDFNNTDGADPQGSLVLSGGLLYGTTAYGGANGSNGTLFAFNPATGTTTPDLFDFNNTDGAYPFGSLVLSGGLLYGTTVSGGANGSNGTLFAFNPATGTTTPDLFDFNNTDGAYPYGSLVLSGGLLYGTTYGGGANGSNGTLFAFNPVTGTTTPDLFDFNYTDGANPYGSLVLSGGLLYGTTANGGANGNQGTLFAFNPATGTTTPDLFDFNGTDGAYPQGSLVLSGGLLYGTTYGGGANGSNGTLFAFNPATGTTTPDLFDFNSTDGAYPYGSLVLSGGLLYGTAVFGGANGGYGTLFAFNPSPVRLFDPSSAILDPAGLKDNGGPVQTIALLAGSPAINAGDDSLAPSTDARGYPRVGVSDIGAFEYQGTVTPPPAPTGGGGGSVYYSLSLSKSGNGSGSITGSGLSNCGSSCGFIAGQSIALTAGANAGSAFVSWGGDCGSSTSSLCELTMTGNKTVSAIFNLASASSSREIIPNPITANSTGTPAVSAPATASTAGSAAPSGPQTGLYPANTLVLDHGAIYITEGRVKYGFTAMKAFKGLGYSLKNVIRGDVSAYSLSAVLLSSPSQTHPVGSWILSKKTVYYVSALGLIPVPSWDIFLNNSGLAKYLVKANTADLKQTRLPNMAPANARAAD